jgi:hypothetical protein
MSENPKNNSERNESVKTREALTDDEVVDVAFRQGGPVRVFRRDSGEVEGDWYVEAMQGEKGDRLYTVAKREEDDDVSRKHGVSVEKITEWQGLGSDFEIGQDVNVRLDDRDAFVTSDMDGREENGWRVVGIEGYGDDFSREFGHGILLAKKIDGRVIYIKTLESYLKNGNSVDELLDDDAEDVLGGNQNTGTNSPNRILEANSRNVESGIKTLKKLYQMTSPAYWAARNMVRRLERQERLANMTPEEREKSEKKRIRTRRIIMGAVGLTAAYMTMRGSIASPDIVPNDAQDLLNSSGDLDGGFGDGFESGGIDYGAEEGAEDVADTAENHEDEGEAEATEFEYSKEAQTIDSGEGWYQTFREMDIPEEHRAELLKKVGPQLVDMGIGYEDAKIGGYGIYMTPDGKMPEEVLDYIRDAAIEEGYIEVPETAQVAQETIPEPEPEKDVDTSNMPESEFAVDSSGQESGGNDMVNYDRGGNGDANVVAADNYSSGTPDSYPHQESGHRSDAYDMDVQLAGPVTSAPDAAEAGSWLESHTVGAVGSSADIGVWLKEAEVNNGVKVSEVTRQYLNDRIGTIYSLGRLQETEPLIAEALRTAGKTIENGVIK